jgi:hypothetical protein
LILQSGEEGNLRAWPLTMFSPLISPSGVYVIRL